MAHCCVWYNTSVFYICVCCEKALLRSIDQYHKYNLRCVICVQICLTFRSYTEVVSLTSKFETLISLCSRCYPTEGAAFRPQPVCLWRASAQPHTLKLRTRTSSPQFGINFHRYWSVQAVPLGKVILHLSPPPLQLPQSQPSVTFTALGMRRNPTGFVSQSLSVLLLSATDWCIRSVVRKHTHERRAYTSVISWCHTQTLSHTHTFNHRQFSSENNHIHGSCEDIDQRRPATSVFHSPKTCLREPLERRLRSQREWKRLIKSSFNPLPYSSSIATWGIENRYGIDQTHRPFTAFTVWIIP